MSSYIDSAPQAREFHPGHYWKAHTFDRLAWVYGHPRAQLIMAGKDPTTEADVAAWRALGGALPTHPNCD